MLCMAAIPSLFCLVLRVARDNSRLIGTFLSLMYMHMYVRVLSGRKRQKFLKCESWSSPSDISVGCW